MIVAGTHKAKAIAGTFGGERGKEQVEVKYEITDGPDRGAHISWFGFFYGSDAEKQTANRKRAVESLLHSGWDGQFTEDLAFAGDVEVSLVIEHEQKMKDGKPVIGSDGKPELRARVKWVNQLGGGLMMKDRLDAGGLADFRKRMSGVVIDAQKRIGTHSGAANGGSSGVRGSADQGFGRSDEDEIPFVVNMTMSGAWDRP